MRASEIFAQNNGEVTKAFYAEVNALGPHGQIAVALFRAQKRSAVAKKYRRGTHKRSAYDVKSWSLQELCKLLEQYAEKEEIRFGWKQDPKTPGFEWVLYVDLPNGQASFHSESRYVGPDYGGEWSGKRDSQEVVVQFMERILKENGGTDDERGGGKEVPDSRAGGAKLQADEGVPD